MARDQAKWFCLVVIVTACCVRSFFVFLWLSYSLCHSLMLQPYKISLCVVRQCMQDHWICTAVHPWHILNTSFAFWMDFFVLSVDCYPDDWLRAKMNYPLGSSSHHKYRFQFDMNVVSAYLHVLFALVKCLTLRDQMTEDCLSLDLTKVTTCFHFLVFLNWVTIVVIKLGSPNKVSLVPNGAEKAVTMNFPTSMFVSFRVFRVQEVSPLSHLTNVDGLSAFPVFFAHNRLKQGNRMFS